jgi:hypothetical protein
MWQMITIDNFLIVKATEVNGRLLIWGAVLALAWREPRHFRNIIE